MLSRLWLFSEFFAVMNRAQYTSYQFALSEPEYTYNVMLIKEKYVLLFLSYLPEVYN